MGRFAASFVDWRRALVLFPILVALAGAVYYFGLRDTTGSTPRATLLDTPAPQGAAAGVHKGELARDFQGYSPEGALASLASQRGRPTIINFWATWCASCAAELPDLRDLQAELGQSSLNIIAVNVGERSSTAKKFLDFIDAPDVRVVMDPSLVVSDAYGVRGMPHSLFLDADGFIRAVYTGQLTPEIMREYVKAAQTDSNAQDIRGPLRLITGVARERTLEVRTISDHEIEFRSKGLRCDDSYCAAPVVDAFEAAPGVLAIERNLESDPPSIVVRFEEREEGGETLAEHLAASLEAFEDPLYALPIEVLYR